MQLFLKILGGMANIADPDVKEQSDLGVHCLHMRFCQKLWCIEFFDIYPTLWEKKTKTKKKNALTHKKLTDMSYLHSAAYLCCKFYL